MNTKEHISEADVIEGHFNGGGYVFYRLPDAEAYTFISQQGRPEELVALDISDTFRGVVIAPFEISPSCPLVLVRPDYLISNAKVPEKSHPKGAPYSFREDSSEHRTSYNKSFQVCHQNLRNGLAEKIVLSRRMTLQNTSEDPWDVRELFYEACRRYPHNYISLWWTERTGCWLVATPETLISKTAPNQWHTMALAGTMKWEEYSKNGFERAWSIKNKEEQKYVANYIQRRMQPYIQQMSVSQTYTAQSADLAHLRTDFTFSIQEGTSLGTLLQCLHPTPAVCGVPQDIARKMILDHEESPRRYYSGFSGPVNMEEKSQIYVSLRCMEISPKEATLYAGGGLLKDSNEEEEWIETQRKMQTMLQLFS